MEKKLVDLLKKSYSPYSKVSVSAIVVTKDGKEFAGVNVENATFTPTICAERNAIFQAVTKGYRYGDFKEIHLTASTEGMLFPCGVCRQVMSEFFEPKTPVTIYSRGTKKVLSLEELMPFSVTSKDLK